MSRHAFSLFWLFLVLLGGCDKPTGDSAPQHPARARSRKRAPRPPRPPWGTRSPSPSLTEREEDLARRAGRGLQGLGRQDQIGRLIVVQTQAMGSGEAVQGIVSGALKPHVFSPASALYVTMLNNAWAAKTASAKVISPREIRWCSRRSSWRCGSRWPRRWAGRAKRSGGASCSRSTPTPRAGARSVTGVGPLQARPPHPEYSNSGLQAILAEAYAGAKKTRGLTATDLDKKETVGKLSEIEQTIVHYGKSTGFFSDKCSRAARRTSRPRCSTRTW